MRRNPPIGLVRVACVALAAGAAGCTSLALSPTSPTAGSIRAEARAIRILGRRIPRPAFDAAMEAASDRGLPGTHIASAESYPALFFPLTWANWVFGFEGAIVRGTWGPLR